MYYNDMNQHHTPHIHAEYSEYKAVYDFNGNCLKGNIPVKQEKLITAWIAIHSEELNALWKLAEEDNQLFTIEPLK